MISPLSAWNEHIPFAGWLIEALRPRTVVELGVHTGVSYFAFCEAMLHLGIDGRCFAVDHWRGDSHTGEYGEEVFEEVSRLNAEHYAPFSTLIRKTFDYARADFDDGEIDLLHIDGFHTYEVVKHDFESWLPTLSASGVVLLHDTAERKDDFGVYKLLEELKQRYSVFEFIHGHGLGVVAVGHALRPEVARLVGLDAESAEARLVRELYAGLGRRLSLEVELGQRQGSSHESEQTPTFRPEPHYEGTVVKRVASGELADLRAAVESQHRENEALTATIEAQRRIIAELRAESATKQGKIDDLHSSTSWRLTAPLRFVMDLGRRTIWKLRALRPDRTATDTGIRRLYERFDAKLERATRRQLKHHARSNPALGETVVSIVMPTYNRAHVIEEAIKSVLRQTHQAWELLIVDDGSTDETEEQIAAFQHEPRIKYVRQERGGVGAARNKALAMSTGDIVAYLDSDNVWDREFLMLMVAAMDLHDTPIGYSATALVENGATVGYRGDEFDFEKCLDANYVDINSFCHRRRLIEDGVRFDPKVRRTNDWDFMLSLTFGRSVSYVPFVGVKYSQSERPDQITLKEPYVFRRLVEARHRRRFEGISQVLEPFDDVLESLPLTFAIRTAGPREVRELWGDHHLAVGLANALERLGHQADIYYLDEDLSQKYDVVLVMRGLAEYLPTPDSVNVIWSISHPDKVAFDEYEAFPVVLVGSMSYRSMVTHVLGRDIVPLLQATDGDRFFPHQGVRRDGNLLFVGNSRKVDRPTVRFSIDAGLPLVIHGSGWDGMVPESVIASTYLPNEEASQAYATAGAVLNDHWESMKDFGFISNRIFDALASGAAVISDSFPELERVFGEKVATFSTRTEFIEVAHRVLASEPDPDAVMATSLEVLENHSLDRRAAAIVEAVHLYLGKEAPPGEGLEVKPEAGRRWVLPDPHSSRLRIGIIPQRPGSGRMSSSAYIRLIQPLTSDLHGPAVDLTVLEPGQLEEIAEQDLVVVSRTALTTIEEAERVIEVTDGGSRLAVDIDDAFHLMDGSHPQFEEYKDLVPALMRLVDSAALIWSSTDGLRDSLEPTLAGKTSVVGNTIDPRLWRRYRKGWHSARIDDRLELLYMGTASHSPDLDMVMPVLRALGSEYPETFRLTLIGLPQGESDPGWLRHLPTPDRSEYPFFARWLRDQAGDFDIGIAPLVDSRFNRLKSDIKILEYTALGLPSIASPVGPYRDLDVVDLCDSEDEWYKTLAMMITDRRGLDERRIQVEHTEATMWRERRAAIAGELMVSMTSANANL